MFYLLSAYLFRILENTPFLTVTDEPEEAGEIESIHVVVAVAVVTECAPVATVEESVESFSELVLELFNLFLVHCVIEGQFKVEAEDVL